MLFAVIFGIMIEIVESFVLDDDTDADLFGTYSIGIIIWATLFCETWKQEQYKTSIQWG